PAHNGLLLAPEGGVAEDLGEYPSRVGRHPLLPPSSSASASSAASLSAASLSAPGLPAPSAAPGEASAADCSAISDASFSWISARNWLRRRRRTRSRPSRITASANTAVTTKVIGGTTAAAVSGS